MNTKPQSGDLGALNVKQWTEELRLDGAKVLTSPWVPKDIGGYLVNPRLWGMTLDAAKTCYNQTNKESEQRMSTVNLVLHGHTVAVTKAELQEVQGLVAKALAEFAQREKEEARLVEAKRIEELKTPGTRVEYSPAYGPVAKGIVAHPSEVAKAFPLVSVTEDNLWAFWADVTDGKPHRVSIRRDNPRKVA